MAKIDISLEELLSVREKLIEDINKEMTDNERKFLLSVKNRTPNWALLGLDAALVSELPSVKWRLINLNKMSEDKHMTAYKNLEAVLYPSSQAEFCQYFTSRV
ncbi:hypothetical protein [Sphingobacterium detergens]|uniref:hypothetical protein n=1 Tax=Sphingobacterium detergens TaxID=1145106 RepID=UPI000E72FCAD|nr:hypothetical protein [Sphingobacterium detergens]